MFSNLNMRIYFQENISIHNNILIITKQLIDMFTINVLIFVLRLILLLLDLLSIIPGETLINHLKSFDFLCLHSKCSANAMLFTIFLNYH